VNPGGRLELVETRWALTSEVRIKIKIDVPRPALKNQEGGLLLGDYNTKVIHFSAVNVIWEF